MPWAQRLFSQVWWLITVILALEDQSQKEYLKLKTNLGYTKFQGSQNQSELQAIYFS